MTPNTILDELHAVREKLMADVGDDLHRYVEDARQRALESGHQILDPQTLREAREKGQRTVPTLPLELPTSDQTIVAE